MGARFVDIEGQLCRFTGCTIDLQNIPIRLAVAGGTAKAAAIVGALRGGHANVLVTDNYTVALVLEAMY